jgi:hypothetical protein
VGVKPQNRTRLVSWVPDVVGRRRWSTAIPLAAIISVAHRGLPALVRRDTFPQARLINRARYDGLPEARIKPHGPSLRREALQSFSEEFMNIGFVLTPMREKTRRYYFSGRQLSALCRLASFCTFLGLGLGWWLAFGILGPRPGMRSGHHPAATGKPCSLRLLQQSGSEVPPTSRMRPVGAFRPPRNGHRERDLSSANRPGRAQPPLLDIIGYRRSTWARIRGFER